jgi:hypothetical protein
MTPYEENRFRPFCSERCQKVDLGTWAAGGFAIPGEDSEVTEATDPERTPPESEDNA